MTAAHNTFTLNSQGYPAHWPQRNPERPDTVASRITDEQKKDLYERKVTTRELAKVFQVREAYMSQLFSGKVPGIIRGKKILFKTRKEYRQAYAARVVLGELSMKAAAKISRVPYRSMARIVQELRQQPQQEPKND